MQSKQKNSVLIVDDEKANIITLTHILSRDYTIYAAKNGQDAIDTAKERLPDVILLDILMPEMDGYEALAILKNTDETKDIPVIFATGLTSDEDEEKGLGMGVADYITKPFSSAVVKLRVRNQVQIRNQLKNINRRLEQQALMSSITKSFLSGADDGELFANMLKEVGGFMGISRILLYVVGEDESKFVCRYEWMDPSLDLETRIGGAFTLEAPILAVIDRLLARGKDLCLHSSDPETREAMARYRADHQDYIIAPIFIGDKMFAVIDFSKEEDGQAWSDSDISLAVLIASVLSGVFERSTMEKQKSIVENSPQMIVYFSEDGTLIYANPAVAEMTGYAPEEIMTSGLGLFLDEGELRLISKMFIPNTMRYGYERFELTMRRKDGEERILAVVSFVTSDSSGAAIAYDVTELRRLQADIIAAKDAAEQSSRVKSELLSRMSHEMHTPMNAIMGMTQIARTADDQRVTVECLNVIDRASRQLLMLIDDMLDIQAVENDALALEYAEFSFRGMLENVLAQVKPYADEKSQSISCETDAAIPGALIGDERRLTQVIHNLLMNAVKFTQEEGGISVLFSVIGEQDGTYTLKAEIADNGIGISKERQVSIFHAFEQVDGGIARKHGGIGIGLAISKRIVEMMGGEMWVESELGEGAKFSFTFKAERGGAAADGSINETRGDGSAFDGKTLLLAEDVELNRDIILGLLKDTQVEIDCAENGEQAVEMFHGDPGKYNAILMDIGMPVMDGWEATRRIREITPEGERVPIIAVTAYTHQEDILKSAEAGMTAHIGKPINYNELLLTLKEYLS